ncbi:MAG: GNAT family N-acetyltransferase, partial [Asticcacaulis sp.]
PPYGPFAATANPSPAGLKALADIPCGPDGLWVVETTPADAPEGMWREVSAECFQMVAKTITPGPAPEGVRELGPDDYADMLDLARMTRPGPFAERTGALGRFVGLRFEGQLVAMAGERMRLDGFTEVSGVCTHPDHRGRGYAAGLMRLIAAGILTRGETPFLHSYASNAVANALYENMGFAVRRSLYAVVMRRSDSR